MPYEPWPSGPPSVLFPTEGASIIRYSSMHVTNDYRYFSRTSFGTVWDTCTWGVLYGHPSWPTGYPFQFLGASGFCPLDVGTGSFSIALAASPEPVGYYAVRTDWSTLVHFSYIPPPPSPSPTASFTNSPREFNESKTVQFNDTSSGNPTSWSWKFRVSDSGDAWVEFSTAQNPTKIFSV